MKKWKEVLGLRQSKGILGSVPPKEWLDTLRDLDRNNLRVAIDFLTEHWKVNSHLYTMGMVSKAVCRWCNAREETTTHLMCKYPAFASTR